MGWIHTALAVGIPAILLAGCAINPVSGRPEIMIVSEATERELGEAEAKRVAETMGLVEDPALTTYVGAVGERLARLSPRRDVPYTFAVVDAAEPNAFALPGGPVYVSRGLLALLNSEDELAAVLGHEIGHIAARHAVRRVTRATPVAVVTGLGAAATGIVSPPLGDLVRGIGEFANAVVLAPYSRDQEREADRIGQELASRAGWDPGGLSRSLHTLLREEALAGRRQRPSYLSTHPALPDRVADAEAFAATVPRGAAAPIAASHDEFLRRLDGLVVGRPASHGVFDGTTFLHPDLDVHVRFPSGWKTANDRRIVAAIPPDGRAVIALELGGPGTDPEAALEAFAGKTKTSLTPPERLTIGDLRAARSTATARTRDGWLALELTCIAHAGRLYMITGATPLGDAERARPSFLATAASFRPLTAGERAGIRQARLRLVRARAGEPLGVLVARAHGAWSVAMAAVANGLEADTPLDAETLVKLAALEAYTPRGGGGTRARRAE